jgi:ABC-type uncharacterized transport system substrate-binding protein
MGDRVDKVPKGARPGDRPIEPVTQRKPAVNRRVARTIGNEMPAARLGRADAVID